MLSGDVSFIICTTCRYSASTEARVCITLVDYMLSTVYPVYCHITTLFSPTEILEAIFTGQGILSTSVQVISDSQHQAMQIRYREDGNASFGSLSHPPPVLQIPVVPAFTHNSHVYYSIRASVLTPIHSVSTTSSCSHIPHSRNITFELQIVYNR